MNNLYIAQLKIRKSAFIDSVDLVSHMNKYAYSMDEKERNLVDFLAKYSEGLPLPSGRRGNAIALALEVNNYVAAEYLIENAERLNLDTNTVVSELGGANRWSLKDEYLYSQLTFDDSVDVIRDKKERAYQQYVEFFDNNKEANKRLEKRLSVTDEDKKVVGK